MTDINDLKPEDMSDVILSEDQLTAEDDSTVNEFEPDASEEMTDEGLEEGNGEGMNVDDMGQRAGITYDPLKPLGESGPSAFSEAEVGDEAEE